VEVASALSEHPLPTHAVGEAAGEVLERIGQKPDLAAVFVTSGHAGALEDITGAIRTILRPRTLVGAAAASIIGGQREVEERPGITVWAARCGHVDPVRISTSRADDGWLVQGLPARAADGERTLVLLADPFTFPTEGFLDQLTTTCPGLDVVGGLTTGAKGAGGARLVLDAEQYVDGAVGVLLDKRAEVVPVLSQGCRPIGAPFVVTRSERNIIFELGGQPALDRLRETIEELEPEERAVAARGLQMGLVIDEGRATFDTGDFVIRNVIGADSAVGAVGVADLVPVGQTVQFHLRDAATADVDLREKLAGFQADGALVFTCEGRGQALFGYPDHDADVVGSALGTRAVGGFLAGGELAPTGGRNHLHALSTSVLAFGPRAVRRSAGPPPSSQ
jgi:small ligand-binding sensory domain FIST